MLCILYYNKNFEKLQDMSQKVTGKTRCQHRASAHRGWILHLQSPCLHGCENNFHPHSAIHASSHWVVCPPPVLPCMLLTALASLWFIPDFLVCFPTRLWDPWGLCAYFVLVPNRVPATCVYHIKIKEWLRNHNFKIESLLFQVK